MFKKRIFKRSTALLMVFTMISGLIPGWNSGIVKAYAETSDSFKSVAAGEFSSAGIDANNVLWTWGNNSLGQLGDGTNTEKSTPVKVKDQEDNDFTAATVSVGKDHTVAIDRDGYVWSWGNNGAGQLGNGLNGPGVNSTPLKVYDTNGESQLGDIKKISAGNDSTVALTNSGNVLVWGYNQFCKLGNGKSDEYCVIPSFVLNEVEGLNFEGVADIAAGWGYAVALKNDGTVWTWGLNGEGQLGYTTTDPYGMFPAKVTCSGGAELIAKAISAGINHTAIIAPDNTVWTWGYNACGKLGIGTDVEKQLLPKQVFYQDGVTPFKAKQVKAGSDSTVAVAEDGTVWAWGSNDYGLLGNLKNYDDFENSNVPSQVKNSDGSNFTLGDNDKVAVGGNHVLATKDRMLITWGGNWYGQLGNGKSGAEGGYKNYAEQIEQELPLNGAAYITTDDNLAEDCVTETPDNDLDTKIENYEGDAQTIEFNIKVSGDAPLVSAELLISAYDVDEEDGELDAVFLNGKNLGFLSGSNDVWSTTKFTVPIDDIKSGNNTVKIIIAKGYSLKVDWGQLIIDGGFRDRGEIVSGSANYNNNQRSVGTVFEVKGAENDSSYILELNLIDDHGNNAGVISHEFSVKANEIVTIDSLKLEVRGGIYTGQAYLFDGDSKIMVSAKTTNTVEVPISSNATVKSDNVNFTIDNEKNTILIKTGENLEIPNVDTFLSNLKKDSWAEWMVIDLEEGKMIRNVSEFWGNYWSDSNKDVSDSVVSGNKLVVLAEDETTIKIYTITIKEDTINDDSSIRHTITKDGNVFLGGKYIELGISPSGYFGTTVAAPTLAPDPKGFHTENMYGNKLGMRIDGDGFDSGSAPTTGDFFLPGSPIEGFGIGYRSTAEGMPTILTNCNGIRQDLTSISTEDASSGTTLKAIITGTTPDGKLKITQVIWFGVDDKVFKTEMTAENLGGDALYDVRYTRSVDPDQDFDKKGTYATKNSVISNPPVNGSAIVIAKGEKTEEPFIFLSDDPSARAAIAGASLLDPYNPELWQEDGSKLLKAESLADTGIHMTFKIGDLAGGETKTVRMGSSLNPKIDEVLKNPAAPENLTATVGNSKVTLNWNTVSDATGYKIYKTTSSGTYGEPIATVAGNVLSYDATELTNGTTYYFVIRATNASGDSLNSDEVSAMPKTVPSAPTEVTVTAGDGQATVSFTAPTDHGGSPITGYIVTSNPGKITATGTGTTITVTGLTNGTTYTFTVRAINAAGNSADSTASNAVTPYRPSNGGSSGGSGTPSTPATGVEILVNGKTETAATATTTKEGDKKVTTIVVDDKKVEEKLQKEGNHAVVTIPVKNISDVVVGTLNGQTVKNMENKEAILELKTEKVAYKLPASQINIDEVLKQIGKQVELMDIAVSVKISEPSKDTIKIVEDTASKNNYQVVVKPVEFDITCTNGNKTVAVSKFNAYVERLVAIPEGVDPNKITTGIVFNPDGTFSHVPTEVTVINGKYYAKINSLTNSTYSVIWNPKTFKDVETHWAKDAVNDMGSRLVVSGVGEDRFEPDRDITRAEFAAITVRALGLMRPGVGKDAFNDVTKDTWYYDAVSIASEYGIISGYGDGKFGPMDKITREQAMAMIARAMKITKLKAELNDGEMQKLLEAFGDSGKAADWAKASIAACVKAEIVSGRNGKMIAPKDNITRAEVAVIVKGLLQKSKLI